MQRWGSYVNLELCSQVTTICQCQTNSECITQAMFWTALPFQTIPWTLQLDKELTWIYIYYLFSSQVVPIIQGNNSILHACSLIFLHIFNLMLKFEITSFMIIYFVYELAMSNNLTICGAQKGTLQIVNCYSSIQIYLSDHCADVIFVCGGKELHNTVWGKMVTPAL